MFKSDLLSLNYHSHHSVCVLGFKRFNDSNGHNSFTPETTSAWVFPIPYYVM